MIAGEDGCRSDDVIVFERARCEPIHVGVPAAPGSEDHVVVLALGDRHERHQLVPVELELLHLECQQTHHYNKKQECLSRVVMAKRHR